MERLSLSSSRSARTPAWVWAVIVLALLGSASVMWFGWRVNYRAAEIARLCRPLVAAGNYDYAGGWPERMQRCSETDPLANGSAAWSRYVDKVEAYCENHGFNQTKYVTAFCIAQRWKKDSAHATLSQLASTSTYP